MLGGCIPRLMIITVAVSNKAPPCFSCEKFGGVFCADVEQEITGKREGLSKCSGGKWGKHLAVDTLGWFLHSLRQRWGNGGVGTSSHGARTLQQRHFVFLLEFIADASQVYSFYFETQCRFILALTNFTICHRAETRHLVWHFTVCLYSAVYEQLFAVVADLRLPQS